MRVIIDLPSDAPSFRATMRKASLALKDKAYEMEQSPLPLGPRVKKQIDAIAEICRALRKFGRAARIEDDKP